MPDTITELFGLLSSQSSIHTHLHIKLHKPEVESPVRPACGGMSIPVTKMVQVRVTLRCTCAVCRPVVLSGFACGDGCSAGCWPCRP